MLSFKEHQMLNDPRFVKRFNEKYSVNKKHDVPYVAGYSKDGKTFYIDRHLPLMDDGFNIEPYLLVHERTEKALIDIFGLRYETAHRIALHMERKALESADHISWKKYESYYTKYIKGFEKEKLISPPPDLDLTPYKDENDIQLYHEILKDEKKTKR
jgi:hypothetical protein